MDKFNKVTAVIVLYNVSDIIFECLKNLKNIKIIIIDNGYNNPAIIKKIKLNKNIIKFFSLKKNIGFGRACNFAFKYTKTEYTLLIEPDVLIKEIDIQRLINGLQKYPDAAIVAPTLINEKNSIIDSLENLPELNFKEDNLISPKANNYENKNIISGDVCVHFCWAAVLLLNNKIIKKTGLFNKKIFIFWEDFFLSRKLKKLKKPIIKIFSSRALHLEGKSTVSSIKSRFIINKHNILSAYIYRNVKKNDKILIKKMFIYFFRFISYLFILNLKNSLKNLAKLCAVISYKNS